jgi:BolA protein
MPTRAQRIETILTQALTPETVIVRDDSHQHIGHAGHREGGETHYHVTVISAQFKGMSRVARQQTVMKLLADEFATGLHALSMDLRDA